MLDGDVFCLVECGTGQRIVGLAPPPLMTPVLILASHICLAQKGGNQSSACVIRTRNAVQILPETCPYQGNMNSYLHRNYRNSNSLGGYPMSRPRDKVFDKY